MPAPLKKQETDFNPSDFLAAHGQHETAIADLTTRISKLEGPFNNAQAFATFLEEFAKDSRNLEGVFAKMFCRFMKENPEVQAAVEKRMAEADRNFFLKNLKRVGFAAYSGIVLVIGICINKFMEWLFTLIPHAK